MRFTVLLLIIFTLISCNFIKVHDDPAVNGEDSYTPVTVLWEETTTDTLKVFTNDKLYTWPLRPSGSRFWKIMPDTLDASADLSCDLTKLSGHGKGTYGVIFSSVDANNCLMLMIDSERNYAVIKITDGALSYMQGDDDWIYSENLFAGFNQHNRIRIKNFGGGNYKVYFNDIEETNIIDNKAPVFGWGKWGFTASVYGGEDFPDHPVDVRFRY
jgi:hypothetical protein